MAIDVAEFDSIDDLDIEFKKRLRKAPDDEAEAQVRSDWQEGKAAFWQHQSQKQMLAGAKRDALDKYPLAKEFADDIRGSTAAEIEASAKRFHERMEKVTADAEKAKQDAIKEKEDAQQQAMAQYGQPAGAGSGQPGRQAVDPNSKQAAIERVHGKLQRGEGLQRAADKMDTIIMGNERLREAIDFQREAHPELGLGVGGSYRGEASQDRKLVDARVEARKQARR